MIHSGEVWNQRGRVTGVTFITVGTLSTNDS